MFLVFNDRRTTNNFYWFAFMKEKRSILTENQHFSLWYRKTRYMYNKKKFKTTFILSFPVPLRLLFCKKMFRFHNSVWVVNE